jgi:hypothetical protein
MVPLVRRVGWMQDGPQTAERVRSVLGLRDLSADEVARAAEREQ